ncbi:MAG: SRPBCC family protein [Proteobacteria bacterium]|nr:SRPBCC family protein [Pseudomonadota bacterium]
MKQTLKRAMLAAAAAAGGGLAGPVQAEVVAQSDTGFVVSLSADVPAAQSAVWNALIAPAKWWSAEHTWSGDAANLYIDAQASGCFCEKIPRPADAPADQRMGSAEHMHVIFADPQRGLLRLRGGLGPLQSEPVDGVWTVTLKAAEPGRTRIEWDYAVTGLMRMKGDQIAPMVDKVMGEQLRRLAAQFDSPEPAVSPPAK